MTTLTSALRRWRADRMAFRREAIILESGQRFGDVIEPWQVEDFLGLDDPRYQHAYLERPRGHAKTSDIGSEGATELILGRPGSQLFCVAADEDQGRLLFDDVAGKLQRSPLLARAVTIGRREIKVRSTGSTLRLLTSDAATNFGLRPDWVAVDELAEHRSRALWDSLWTASGKRPGCRMLVISTAGWDRTSVAWEVRENARREADWYFSSRGQCASWIRPEWLDQQRRTLPAHVFARLHLNQWVEGVGAFLTSTEVDAVFGETVPSGIGPGAIGCDIGLSKDKSVAAFVRRAGATVVVEGMETWAPPRSGEKVDLRDVEDGLVTLAQRYGVPVVLDPWQGVLMAQRLRARGIDVHEYTFTGEARRRLFNVLLDLIRTGRLRSRPHDDLRTELLGLEVQETASGWRVDHRAGRHDDHVVAVALAAQKLAAPACPHCSDPQCSGFHIWSLDAPPPVAPREPARDLWAESVELDWSPPVADPTLPIAIGLELRADSAAAAAVAPDDGGIRVLLRTVRGEHTVVETAVRQWATEFHIERACANAVDPDLGSRLAIMRLAETMPLVEADAPSAATVLAALLTERHLVVYQHRDVDDPAVRRAIALGCLAAERMVTEEATP